VRRRLPALCLLCACASTPKSGAVQTPGLVVHGQGVPAHVLPAKPGDFEVAPDVAVLHYYGAGGWGISWRGTYLLTAPYFSNHPLLSLAESRMSDWLKPLQQSVVPNVGAVRAGFAGTPVARTQAILIGHGHVDHAGDVPAFFEPGLIKGTPALIADRSTMNELAAMSSRFGCIAPIDYGNADTAASACPVAGVRITAIHHAHAPHVNVAGLEVAAFGGFIKTPRETLPSRAEDYKLGNTWAFLIDLLDEKGGIAFRIHYVDAAASPPHGIISQALLAQRDVDLHIACVPGFEQSDDYPEAVLDYHHVHYVLLGHWEDFFQPRTQPLRPLRNVLDARAIDRFVDVVERVVPHAQGVAPLNKSAEDCRAPSACGPRGEAWAMPVPGETYQFATGRQRLTPPASTASDTPR
jgi:hypothetical protein